MLNTKNTVGKILREILSTRLALYLPSRTAGPAAAATADAFGVDDARGLPLATPSVLPPPAVPPADDDDDDDDVSLRVVRSVDDDALLYEQVPDAAGDQKLVTLATSELTCTLR